MPGFDKKTQMMDAGSVFYKTPDGFGYALGAVMSVLTPLGKLYEVSEDGGKFSESVRLGDLPDSIEEADFFLDCSTPWRNRYISCKVEDSPMDPETEGTHRYAVRLREGNSNTLLRRSLLICSAVILLLVPFLCGWGFIAKMAGLCVSVLFLWLLVCPSESQQKKVEHIKESLKFP